MYVCCKKLLLLFVKFEEEIKLSLEKQILFNYSLRLFITFSIYKFEPMLCVKNKLNNIANFTVITD